MSSIRIKELFDGILSEYGKSVDRTEPVWQAKYYGFNLYTEAKTEEKLGYMHMNPVRAGLVERPSDWRWSSARWYESRRTVGVPISWVD